MFHPLVYYQQWSVNRRLNGNQCCCFCSSLPPEISSSLTYPTSWKYCYCRSSPRQPDHNCPCLLEFCDNKLMAPMPTLKGFQSESKCSQNVKLKLETQQWVGLIHVHKHLLSSLVYCNLDPYQQIQFIIHTSAFAMFSPWSSTNDDFQSF